jgi:hypothetical protein
MERTNLLDSTILLILKVNTSDMHTTGSQKKRFVMDFLERQFKIPEEWQLYQEMVSALVDFLVEVGKRRKDFNLTKSKIFSCCQ